MDKKNLSKTDQKKWYVPQQRFSIRKYHFGAASVLLGVALALAGGAEASALTTDTSTSTSPSTAVETTGSTTDTTTDTTDPSTATSTTDATATTDTTASTDTSATIDTATTEAVAERTATIDYTVEYQDETGAVVASVAKSTSITTTYAVAIAIVSETAEVPAGYELVAGEVFSTSAGVIEGGNTKIIFKVVKQVVTSTTESTTTPSSTTATTEPTTTDTALVPATTNVEPAAETTTAPATIEEARTILEQVASEAAVLASEGERLVATTEADNTALQTTTADARTVANQSEALLADSVATLEQVNAQINAVRKNVEALALELRKRDEDGVLTAMLTTTTTSTLGIGEGSGTLINTSTTATPDMTDPNGAAVTAPVEGTYVGTTEVGYVTVDFTPLSYYDAIMGWQKYRDLNGQSTGGAYFRTSVLTGAPSSPLLVELVDKTGSVLESKFITQGETASFTTFQATSGVNLPLEVTYRPDAGSTSIYGTTFFTFDENTMEVSRFLPQPVTATTYYKTLPNPDSTNLATYEIGTVPGATTTPSGQREFLGYAYDSTTTETTTLGLSATVPYVDYARANLLGVGHKTVVSPIDSNGTIVRDFYVAGTSVEGTLDYFSTDTTGFIHILTSSQMAPGESNTAMIMNSDLLDKGYKVYIVDASQAGQTNNDIIPPNGILVTDPAQLDFSSLSTTNHWFHIVINENPVLGELGFTRVRLGSPQNASRIQLQYNTRLDGTKDVNGDGQPDSFLGTNIGFAMNNTPVYSLTETTYWYTPIPQIAQIIYQTEDGTQLDGIDIETGNPGELINYSTTNRINAYKLAGYELVFDGGPQSGQDATYDFTNDDATDPSQKFYVVLKERVKPVDPTDPNTPTPKPGEPVDPTDPNSPLWPDSVKDLETTQEVVRTITYEDEAGNEVATKFEDKVTFTRTAQVNLVTGDITYGAWTADNADNVLDGKVLPEVPGYTATTATKNGANVTPESTTVYAQVTADSADIVEKVVYVQDTQTAKITISTVDANGGNKTEYATVNETGKHTEPVATTTVEEKLLELKRKGYDVETKVTDTFLDSAKTFDNVKDTTDQPSQVYEIVVKERVVDVPKDVVPGQPVDPNDPNSPVWPDSVKDLVTTEEVTRTITYVDNTGKTVFETVTETKEFTRTAEVNLVTGEIIYGEWTPTQTFEDVPSPLLDGYIADIKVVSTDPVNAEDADIETVVTYKKLGSWVPELPEGETPVPPITYPNDPNEDPTIPGQPTPTPGISEIPGYVPVGPDGNELPKDPNTGQYIPPVPVDPTVDTPIRYVKQEQQATITFVNVTDPANPVTLVTIPLDGVTGDQFGYDTDPVVANYQKAGYTVTNKDNYSKDGVYSADPADHDAFVFELVQRVEVVDPNDPNTPTPKPGEPVDPTDPNSPVWSETVKDLVTTEEVTRIISYVDNQKNTVFESVTETKKFTRTAEINLVTGVITYGEWSPVQSLAEVTSPKHPNHLVSLPVVAAQEVTAVDPDIHVEVVYTPLGSWVPVVPPGYPEVPETVYPVDPEDPTKPGTDVPTIPYIPGIVPTIPNPDNPNETIPLQPVDPNDPTKGYVVPPVPEDPTQDTEVTYELADQKATVNYVDESGKQLATSGELTGKSGEVIDYSTTPTIEDLLKKGYELVSNDYPAGATYDKDATVDQVFTVVLKERVVPVDPTDPTDPNTPTPTPKPGEPVDPTDPNSPVWPDSVKDLVTTEEVTRTITYVDKDGKTVFETVTETKEFTRTADINLVTGVITYGEWTPTQTLEAVTSPLLANHLVDTPVVKGQDVNATDPDINVTVVYTPLGSWVPVVPLGYPEVPEMVYPVDPEDPTKPGTEVPSVPHIPGTTPVTPDPENPGTFIPLTPVDPEDPNKGYIVPNIPTDPTKDTPIVYVEDNKQLASVTIVDESTGNTISTFFEQGKPGFKVGINTDEKLVELIKAGYTVTSDEYNDSEKVYDKDDNVDQSWTIKVTPRIEPVDPTNPNTPTPVPGQPVDPTDPNSPVWPDSVKDLVTTQEVVRTITYVNEAGETVATQVVQKVNFTRTAQVNLVTGEITYGEWTPAQELPAVSSPVVKGYYTETPLVDLATVNAEDADITVPVVYKKLGNWVPQIPDGHTPVDPLPYPNDPENPTVPGTDVPVIPYVPGHTPEDPNGNPLTPVDPEDPTKGYIPPTPENPGVDTPITYTPNAVQLTVKYVDENGNELVPTETRGAQVGDKYTTTPKVIDGYYLVAIPSNQNGKIGEEGTTVVYVYKKLGNWIPQIPDGHTPVDPMPYPNDPENPGQPGVPDVVIPYVPGHTPEDPNGNPLTPVDPEDPTKGYIPPTPENPGVDTPIIYIPVTPTPDPEPTPEPQPEPVPAPKPPVAPASPAPVKQTAAQLPNTGESSTAAVSVLGAGMLIATLALAGKRRKKDEE